MKIKLARPLKELKVLTKEQILQVNDLPKELVKVPEWDGEVYVKTLTADEYAIWQQSIMANKDKLNLAEMQMKLCVLTICNETGSRLFTDSEFALLGGKSAPAITRIFEVAQRLNKIGTKDIEELEKN